MKIVIPGGSGQVGTMIARNFHQEGHEVVVLSRQPQKLPWKTVVWDGKTSGPWVETLENTDAVINLAGHTVNCRYTSKNRRLIMESRVAATQAIGQAVSQASQPPRVWLQASTATIYAHRYDAPNDETTGLIGGNERGAPAKWRFSIDVAQAWERAANQVQTPNTRKVLMRAAMIMSPDKGGIFDTLLRLVRFGLGGKVGDGRQYVSWIHEQDFVRIISWLIENNEIEGVVNVAAPNPLPYAAFMRILRQTWGVPFGLPATKWMLEIGAFFLQTESELVLKSRRVVPARLLRSGFTFQLPEWEDAADDLCSRIRSAS